MDIELSQYMGMYIDGSQENLNLMDKFLLAIEQDPSNLEAVGEIFRAAHTLKGMSATMGFDKIAQLTHEMENILDQLRNHKIKVSTTIINALFETFDVLRTLINDVIEATDSGINIDNIIEKLYILARGSDSATEAITIATGITTPSPSDTASQLAPDLTDVVLNEFEYQLLVVAHNQNFNIMLMIVTLVADCILKAPRAFMVSRNLEELDCEVIRSVPDTMDIEEEAFDLSFKMVLIGAVDPSVIIASIGSISEIYSVTVNKLTPCDFQTYQSSADNASVEIPSLPHSISSKPTEAQSVVAVDSLQSTSPVELESLTVLASKKVAVATDKRSSQTVRVDMRRLDELMNLVGELVINRTRLDDIGATHRLKDLNEALSRVSQISSSLQNVVMQVRMVPIDQVFNRFPRMVRDLSKKLNKKINLVVEGKETEMDRTVIDEIGDPMVHLIRNSIDHGIETPEERIAKGKPDVGTITLVARHEGNSVLIEVKDDGKGVDPSIIGRLAVERGLFTQEQISKMPPEEIIKIIFMPGFSTAKIVSDISGRGVGMDAVKVKLEEMNGVLGLESKVDEGSCITIKLPLTLAILPALMVKIGNEMFAIPLGSVKETMDITKANINIVQHQEVTLLRGDVLPIIRLRNILDVPTTEEEFKAIEAKEEEISIVVCHSGEKLAGFMVDELYGQQEIVIKSLGNLLGGLPGIMGATMRGDGSIALILDIPSFFQKGRVYSDDTEK